MELYKKFIRKLFLARLIHNREQYIDSRIPCYYNLLIGNLFSQQVFLLPALLMQNETLLLVLKLTDLAILEMVNRYREYEFQA